jgi:hypothetical protein
VVVVPPVAPAQVALGPEPAVAAVLRGAVVSLDAAASRVAVASQVAVVPRAAVSPVAVSLVARDSEAPRLRRLHGETLVHLITPIRSCLPLIKPPNHSATVLSKPFF